MRADAVFQGGGVKAIGFVGAINCLEENGFTWQRVAGTSAGALIAALISVGYKGHELKDIMLTTEYRDFLERKGMNRVPFIGKPLSILLDKGIYCGDNLETWIHKLLSAKGKTKFRDVSINGKSKLKIIASDITNKKILILPKDIACYGEDPMELSISKAVRMSISIPYYFKPVVIKYNNTYNYIVDGGILSNFPIWIFDVKGEPRWPTFGFKFKEDMDKKNGKNNFIGFTKDLIEAIINNYDEVYLTDKDKVRTISIPTNGVKTTDFYITKKKSLELFNLGYTSSKEFLTTWDFYKYVKKYRLSNKVC